MSSSAEPRVIDLNADLGEGPDEDGIFPLVTSANIACGGHAGTLGTMAAAIDRCLAHGVAIGAHPSYQDVPGFGRVSARPPVDASEITSSVELQVALLASHARDRGGALAHVKPHGALYNDAARDPAVARAVGEGVLRAARDAVLVGLAGSPALAAWEAMGLRTAAEGFADRGYREDGSLAPRGEPGAVLLDPEAAAAQALKLAGRGGIATLCVHGDTPGAIRILEAVRSALLEEGFVLAAPAVRAGARRPR